MAESRLRRFVGGLGLGYIHTIVTIIVGLWLTPYVLRHLGSHDTFIVGILKTIRELRNAPDAPSIDFGDSEE